MTAEIPEPKTVAPTLSREEVLDWLRSGKRVAGRNFVLVDVRRNDFEGGTIRGSLNLPAQSLFLTLPTIYNVLAATQVQDVVFYCGSSRGRGPRTAGWFADYLADKQGHSLKCWVLEGGIKGWVKAGPEYTEWMDGYEPTAWENIEEH
ncbi:hypothetical protein VTN49DRAFT_727 [Thermomyces lanuginosus]|uniref:uncharacterized protein n=1 Tax=Thermomyces lanuginosus TaxID=5541 RepID=UPI003742E06F